ncbi:hypothetical protein TNCV_199101 [Trichonephila clavipes]|nr:hypothetical protein TNCV_199101 [Trichonephila clavipes]
MHNQRNVINFVISCIIVISFTLATVCSVKAADDPILKRYYGFYLAYLEENVATFLIRFVVVQLIFFSQHTFTCIAAVMSGVLYYSLSELFHLFCLDLQAISVVENYKTMQARMWQHVKLFEIANELEKTLSTVSCVLFCSQMTSMYIAFVTYVLVEETYLSAAMVWENVPQITLIPSSVIGLTLCAWKASTEIKNCRMYLQGLHDRLIYEPETDNKTLKLVKVLIPIPLIDHRSSVGKVYRHMSIENDSFPYHQKCTIEMITDSMITQILITIFPNAPETHSRCQMSDFSVASFQWPCETEKNLVGTLEFSDQIITYSRLLLFWTSIFVTKYGDLVSLGIKFIANSVTKVISVLKK